MREDRPLSRHHSTREFYREGKKADGYSFFDFLHGYIYGRWPYLYIGVGTGEHPLSKWLRPIFYIVTTIFGDSHKAREEGVTFADTYHGKVLPPHAASQLVTVQEDILLEDLEPIIPYKKARDIVLKNPDHIVVLDCPCRNARPDPCLPMDVCLIIGEPFAGFVLDHQPQRSRAITSEEALSILSEEHKRGHVHHAFFKDAMLERFYAICNCCSCCCGAMQAQRNSTRMLTSSGYTARVDDELCILCGDCEDLCPFGAVEFSKEGVSILEETCMGCGVCVGHCDQEAMDLVLDSNKGEPLLITSLMEKHRAAGLEEPDP